VTLRASLPPLRPYARAMLTVGAATDGAHFIVVAAVTTTTTSSSPPPTAPRRPADGSLRHRSHAPGCGGRDHGQPYCFPLSSARPDDGWRCRRRPAPGRRGGGEGDFDRLFRPPNMAYAVLFPVASPPTARTWSWRTRQRRLRPPPAHLHGRRAAVLATVANDATVDVLTGCASPSCWRSASPPTCAVAVSVAPAAGKEPAKVVGVGSDKGGELILSADPAADHVFGDAAAAAERVATK